MFLQPYNEFSKEEERKDPQNLFKSFVKADLKKHNEPQIGGSEEMPIKKNPFPKTNCQIRTNADGKMILAVKKADLDNLPMEKVKRSREPIFSNILDSKLKENATPSRNIDTGACSSHKNFESGVANTSTKFIESRILMQENIDPLLSSNANTNYMGMSQRRKMMIRTGSSGKLDMKPLAQKEIQMESSQFLPECESPSKRISTMRLTCVIGPQDKSNVDEKRLEFERISKSVREDLQEEFEHEFIGIKADADMNFRNLLVIKQKESNVETSVSSLFEYEWGSYKDKMAELLEKLESFLNKDRVVNSSLLENLKIENKIVEFLNKDSSQKGSSANTDFDQLRDIILNENKANIARISNEKSNKEAKDFIETSEKEIDEEMEQNFKFMTERVDEIIKRRNKIKEEREKAIQISLNDMINRHVEGEKYLFDKIADLTQDLKMKIDSRHSRAKIEPELEKKIAKVKETIINCQVHLTNSDRSFMIENLKSFVKKLEETQRENEANLQNKLLILEIGNPENGGVRNSALVNQLDALKNTYKSIKSGLEQMKEDHKKGENERKSQAEADWISVKENSEKIVKKEWELNERIQKHSTKGEINRRLTLFYKIFEDLQNEVESMKENSHAEFETFTKDIQELKRINEDIGREIEEIAQSRFEHQRIMMSEALSPKHSSGHPTLSKKNEGYKPPAGLAENQDKNFQETKLSGRKNIMIEMTEERKDPINPLDMLSPLATNNNLVKTAEKTSRQSFFENRFASPSNADGKNFTGFAKTEGKCETSKSREEIMVKTVEENLLKIKQNLNVRKSILADINDRLNSGTKEGVSSSKSKKNISACKEDMWQQFEDYNEDEDGSVCSSESEENAKYIQKVSIFDRDPIDFSDRKDKFHQAKVSSNLEQKKEFCESSSSIKSNEIREIDAKSSCRELDYLSSGFECNSIFNNSLTSKPLLKPTEKLIWEEKEGASEERMSSLINLIKKHIIYGSSFSVKGNIDEKLYEQSEIKCLKCLVDEAGYIQDLKKKYLRDEIGNIIKLNQRELSSLKRIKLIEF